MTLPKTLPDVASLLRALPPEVQNLVHAVRKLVLAILPGVEETADSKARLIAYGYGPGYKGMVATIILSKTGAKLGIVRGAELPDPAGLLDGEGKVHRHIPFKTIPEVDRPEVRDMLEVALAAWKKRNAS